MKTQNFFARPQWLAALALISAGKLHAQSYVVDAQISGQADGGMYDYTLTLNNRSSSTTSIGTFWFAWTDYGYDLLPSSPTVTQTPAGWSASVLGGSYDYYGYTYYDGYSIQFTTSSAYLNPGSSLTFEFTSPDSPSDISGINPYFGNEVETSFVYSGGPFSDAGSQFLVETVVPEPAALGLLLVAGGSLMVTRWRRNHV
jgi:hypothetical protein